VEKKRLADRQRRERDLRGVVGRPDEPAMAREIWNRHEQLLAIAETRELDKSERAELNTVCAAWKRMLKVPA
jgi:hypothetical protein